MDYYRLSAMARSEDGWCKSQKHIKAILESIHPPIEEITHKSRFERYEDRERKMFFSRETLQAHFESPAHIQSLLKCECKDCAEARKDKWPWSEIWRDIRVLPNVVLFLAVMTYLGKVHYIYYWIKWGIVSLNLNDSQDGFPVCPDDGLLKDLINDDLDREMFRSAYERAIRMLSPVCFEITPALVCFYLDYDGPNLDLKCPKFKDLRFPYQKESLIVSQGFFGVMSKLEILPQFLHDSVLEGMKKYPRVEGDRPVCLIQRLKHISR